jgi:hypothetical protein
MLTAVLALLLVYLILRETELYVPRILDGDWVPTINDTERKGGPFNKCSPESFGECEKPEFRYLSRY